MIIYGYKYPACKLQPALGAACPDCGKSNLMVGTRHGYAHIYWIPLLPLKRKQIGVCQSCNKEFDSKAIKSLAASPGTGAMIPQMEPLRIKYFALSLALVIAFSAFGYNDVKTHNELIAAVSAPQAGDRGVVRLAKPVVKDGHQFSHTIFRIDEVGDSTVKVKFSDYLFTDSAGAKKLAVQPPEDAFPNEQQELSKQQLLVMAGTGQISDFTHTER